MLYFSRQSSMSSSNERSFASAISPRSSRYTLIASDAPVLRVGGASQGCVSRWGQDGIYDMVGNLDEWVEDPKGSFRGGFYARRVTVGCEARISSHSHTYFDYSTGTRCCKDAR